MEGYGEGWPRARATLASARIRNALKEKYLCQFEIISPFHFFIGKSKDSGCKLGKSQAGRGTESGLRND